MSVVTLLARAKANRTTSGSVLNGIANAAQAGNEVQFRKDLLAFDRLVMQADKRKTA